MIDVKSWPRAAVAIGLFITVFLILSVVILFGIPDVPHLNASLLTFSGITLGAISGGLVILTPRRDDNGRLTPWGWVAFYGILVSFCVSATSMVINQRMAEQQRQATLDRIEKSAIDLRRVALRGQGVRLRFEFSPGETLFPDNFKKHLEDYIKKESSVEKQGIYLDQFGYGINSCNRDFPDLNHPEMGSLREVLSNQHVFVALGDSTVETRLEQVGSNLEPGDDPIGLLELTHQDIVEWVNITTSIEHDDQIRDCSSGIRGDWTLLYRANPDQGGNSFGYRPLYPGYSITFQYRLPKFSFWRGDLLRVKNRNDVEGSTLLVVSSALRRMSESKTPFKGWSLERALVELPDGRSFCGDLDHAKLIPLSDDFGAFTTRLVGC